MANFFSDGVPVGNRERRRNRDIHFSMQTMTQPARSNISHFLDCLDVLERVPYFIDQTGIDAVKHSREDRLD